MSKLKAYVKSLDDVPQDWHSLYIQEDDGYVLDVEDRDFKAKVSEFRDNNIALRRELDKSKEHEKELATLRKQVQRFKGIDPEKAAEAMKKIQAVEEQKMIDAGQIDEIVQQRTERMRADLEEKNQTAEARAKKFEQLYRSNVIDNGLQQAINQVGRVRSGAMTFALKHGHDVWTVDEEGRPVPQGKDGQVLYGKDGKQAITMQEWAQSLMVEAPYLFEDSAGGGSSSTKRDGAGAKRIPYNDQATLNASIEDIASGKAEVTFD